MLTFACGKRAGAWVLTRRGHGGRRTLEEYICERREELEPVRAGAVVDDAAARVGTRVPGAVLKLPPPKDVVSSDDTLAALPEKCGGARRRRVWAWHRICVG